MREQVGCIKSIVWMEDDLMKSLYVGIKAKGMLQGLSTTGHLTMRNREIRPS